ncbi:hypothetical protein ACFQHV_17325 [Promicromonospora thailandica]|uniref:hypothetical protein n=1 Tax=Promicromonospora thailandica TaxID=765201 RepID=UPI0020A27851|nr:hypothetical protein [Promicromonospora thailandica]BFF20560.1 hypothetical protein GCM10025730_40810 [Promicromonospora thailandica]
MKIGTNVLRAGVGAALLAAMVGAGAAGAAFSAEASQGDLDADLPPYAVEDFNYPGAEQILVERGIELKRGDGHIVLADCSGSNLIRISARGQSSLTVCFRATGNEGWLTLELPGAFLVRTNDYESTHLELAASSGDTQSFDVGPNDIQSVGEADPGSGGQQFALLEIRVSR